MRMGRGKPAGRAVRAWIVTALVLLVTAPVRAAEQGRADLYLWIDARGDARVLLRLGFAPPEALPLETLLAGALGAPLHDTQRDTDADGATLQAECSGAFRRR